MAPVPPAAALPPRLILPPGVSDPRGPAPAATPTLYLPGPGVGRASAAAAVPYRPGTPIAAAASGAAAVQRVTATPATEEPQGQLFVGNKDTLQAIINAIDGAQQVATVEMFSIAPNGSGKQLGDALVRAAHRGVDANLLADFVAKTSWPVPWVSFPRWANQLRENGVKVHVTKRLGRGPEADKVVDHRKIVTVDGTTAFVGGMNFAKFMDGWHDAMFKVTGPSVAPIVRDNLERMQAVGMEITPQHRAAVEAAERAAAAPGAAKPQLQLLTNHPDRNQFQATEYYRDRIRNAKERLWIATPAASDQSLVDDIAAAARRGVDVRVVTPGKAPLVPLIKLATRASMRRVIDAGGKVWETPEVSHLKAMVVDDEATVGSYNITKRSANADTEMTLVSSNPAIRGQVEQLFASDMGRSRPLAIADTRGAVQRIFNTINDKLKISY